MAAPAQYRDDTGPEYFLDFGYPNVYKFTALGQGDVSQQLKDFVVRTRSELQLGLEAALAQNPSLALSRADLLSAAYQTHSSAYERGGFFNLSVSDIARVGLTPKLGDVANSHAVSVYGDMYNLWNNSNRPVTWHY